MTFQSRSITVLAVVASFTLMAILAWEMYSQDQTSRTSTSLTVQVMLTLFAQQLASVFTKNTAAIQSLPPRFQKNLEFQESKTTTEPLYYTNGTRFCT